MSKDTTFVIDNVVYTNKKGSYYYTINGGKKPYPPQAILKHIYKQAYGAIKMDFALPEIFSDMSPACRRRAQKMIEHHFYPSIQLPYLEQAAQIIEAAMGHNQPEDARFISSYVAALQATEGDKEQAAALVISCGDTTLPGSTISRSSFYQLTCDDKGIQLLINYPQSLDERVESALSAMRLLADYQRSHKQQIFVDRLVAHGLRQVTSYSGFTISYTKRFYLSMRALMTYYAEHFATNQEPRHKTIRMPYNLLSPQLRRISWDDIVVLHGYAATPTGRMVLGRVLRAVKGWPRNIPVGNNQVQKALTKTQLDRAIEVGCIEVADARHYIIRWPDIMADTFIERIHRVTTSRTR